MEEKNILQRSIPLETIVHRTASRPFSLYRTAVNPGESCALYRHCHPEAELFYLEQGSIDFLAENDSFSLREGEGIFVPPGQIHSAINQTEGSCCHRALVFDLNLLEQNLPPYCQTYFAPLKLRRLDCVYPITREREENTRLLTLLPAVFSLPEPELARYELSLIGILLLCWQELYNLCFSRLGLDSSDHSLRGEIQKSLDFLQQHFSEPLTLAELSEKVGFSESHFCRRFRDCTGYAPFAYLKRLRIVKSCELLTQTDKKITEIAILCGFNSISYFNRTFQKIMGTAPSDYRSLSRPVNAVSKESSPVNTVFPVKSKTPLQVTGYQSCSAAEQRGI